MKLTRHIKLTMCCLAFSLYSVYLSAQHNPVNSMSLSPREQSIIAISAITAKGDLTKLRIELNDGLDAGLTINQIKEALVHLYAYCGFPRSIRGLQTFMEVLNERKARGLNDLMGSEASPINSDRPKYERGKEILAKLTGRPQDGPKTGYSAFSPEIDVFLKEHLFADIFERDVLTWSERELVTISVISSIGGAEPMLRSHLEICLNIGLTTDQLKQFVDIMKTKIGDIEGNSAQKVLDEILNKEHRQESVFPKGEIITNNNFTGTAWLQMFDSNDSIYNISMGNVTFEPKARTNWHKHPGGQILLVTSGRGYYQEKGKPAQVIKKGDVVRIPPNTEHWHGATKDSEMSHLAISTNLQLGKVEWLQPVTEEEYNNL